MGLPLVALLQALGLALSLTPHGGALVRHSRTRAAPLQSQRQLYDTTSMGTGDGADILPAAAMDNPVLARVVRAANAAVTNPNLRGTEVGSRWVPEYLREEFRASVRGLRFDHAPGDGRFEALYAAAGRDAETPLGLQGGARLARICGGRHWDLLVYLFPASASTPGPAAITQQPDGTIQLLKPLIGVWEHAIDKREGKVRGRVQVRRRRPVVVVVVSTHEVDLSMQPRRRTTGCLLTKEAVGRPRGLSQRGDQQQKMIANPV